MALVLLEFTGAGDTLSPVNLEFGTGDSIALEVVETSDLVSAVVIARAAVGEDVTVDELAQSRRVIYGHVVEAAPAGDGVDPGPSNLNALMFESFDPDVVITGHRVFVLVEIEAITLADLVAAFVIPPFGTLAETGTCPMSLVDARNNAALVNTTECEDRLAERITFQN